MSPSSSKFLLSALLALLVTACTTPAPNPPEAAGETVAASCPAPATGAMAGAMSGAMTGTMRGAGVTCPICPVCPPEADEKPDKPKQVAKPFQMATWADLPGWLNEDLPAAFEALRRSCLPMEKQLLWRAVCTAAKNARLNTPAEVTAWFESQLQPWALVNPDGTREGLITGYYEPVIKASRTRKPPYTSPLFAPPDDMVTVELAELYPELKHLRLRGRLVGKKLVPYYSRADWSKQEEKRANSALFWLDDALDNFFLQVQGSGQLILDDGSRVRVNYADQNGHPYRSIGKWLIDQGELKSDQASMQGIKAWAKANPKRLAELLNTNPSLVFFREMPVEGIGPPGAFGLPLTPERSIAVDPRHISLGTPVYLSTTHPNDSRPLQRLMLAQDTGGAIRGVVRADFFWGSGADAGNQAGKMKQRGAMWALLPKGFTP